MKRIPKKTRSKKPGTYSITQFRQDYPNNDTCLEKLFQIKYGKLTACPRCGVVGAKFKRIATRPCYQCVECEYQLHPMAGTVFQKTRTPLVHWFYAIYLFTATRNGVAAKELQRQLKITYKTAWRTADQIRKLMVSPSTELLSGIVMADETLIGGLEKNKHKNKKTSRAPGEPANQGKTVVFGMIDSKGRMFTQVLDGDASAEVLRPLIEKNVDKTAVFVTDGFKGYIGLNKRFKEHHVINHEIGEYANEQGYSTNKMENHWSSLKRMIKGTHIHVDRKHLHKYVAENIFRFTNRNRPDKMFELILKNA